MADEEDHTVGPGTGRELRGAEREEKLREGLYELRRMNEVFDSFLSSLEAARGHNEVRYRAPHGTTGRSDA